MLQEDSKGIETIEQRLQGLGLKLPSVSSPGGNYVSVNIRGKIAYVAIQFPILNGDYLYQGRLGEELGTEEGLQAMQLCALNVIVQAVHKVGLEKIDGLNHLDAYYQSAESWDDAPTVVDGASNLMVSVLEEKGLHTRAIFGVERLPRNFSVGLTASFTLK